MKAHTSQVHGFTAFTFSGCCVSVKSPITDIDGFTAFTFSGLCIFVKWHTFEIYGFMVFTYPDVVVDAIARFSPSQSSGFFIKRTYRRRDFCCLRFFASSEFSRYRKLVSAFPRFSKDDIFQSFSFAILQVVVFHVSGFLSSQLSWFSLSLGPEGTLLYIRDWLPYTCVGCRLRGSASSCI